MIKLLLLLFLLPSSSWAIPGGGSAALPTINCTDSWSVDDTTLVVDCANDKVTVSDLRVLSAPISSTSYFGSEFSTTGTTAGVCVATITATTDGNPVMFFFAGSTFNGGGAVFLTILLDGDFPSSSTSVIVHNQESSWSNGSFVDVLSPSSGSHNYCLGFYGASGTSKIRSNSKFGIVELR